jgi:hypothetical protein
MSPFNVRSKFDPLQHIMRGRFAAQGRPLLRKSLTSSGGPRGSACDHLSFLRRDQTVLAHRDKNLVEDRSRLGVDRCSARGRSDGIGLASDDLLTIDYDG